MLIKRILIGSLTLFLCSCGTENAAAPEPLSVNAIVVQPEMISETVYAPCRLQAGDEAVISVAMPAVVEEVLVQPGDTVEAGQRLLVLRTDDMRRAELTSAAAVVSAARASEEYASANLARASELFNNGAMSPSEYQQVQTAASAAQATYRQSLAGYSAVSASTGSGYVTAPFNGITGRILVTQGNPASGPLLSMFSGDILEAELLLAPVHLMGLKEGLPALFQTDHYPGTIFRGTVASVSQAADPVSGLVSLTVQFPDTTGRLIPGISGMAMISMRTADSAVVLSETAMTPAGECCWEVAVIRDGRAELIMVQTGISNGIRHEVANGLAPGDSVITLGHNLVSQGQQVRVVNQ